MCIFIWLYLEIFRRHITASIQSQFSSHMQKIKFHCLHSAHHISNVHWVKNKAREKSNIYPKNSANVHKFNMKSHKNGFSAVCFFFLFLITHAFSFYSAWVHIHPQRIFYVDLRSVLCIRVCLVFSFLKDAENDSNAIIPFPPENKSNLEEKAMHV